MINPLDLPHIIYVVGYNIPLWTRRRSEQYTFHPKDLLACIRVNWAWYRTMTPLLWVVYHELWNNIPRAIVEKNSAHIRYLNLPYTKPNPIFRSTLLCQLSIRPWGDSRLASALIRSNPQLKDLSYFPPCKNEGANVLADSLSAFNSLSRLQRLKVCQWENLDTDQLIRTIGNNCHLQELCLVDFVGFQRFDQCLLLENLAYLCLESPLDGNPGFCQFVQRCPDLGSLKYFITVSNLTADLCRNIRQCCLKLSTLELLGSASPHTAMSSRKQDTHVMLIESVRHLRSFVLYAESMTPRICQALLDLHCDWLEKLDLTIHQPGAEDFSTANRILASCPNLVSFAMSAVYYFESWRPVDCLNMFSRLWICTKLMKVQVCGFAPTTMLVDRRVDGGESAASSTESGPNVGEDHLISTYGWVAHVPDNREAHITAKDQTMLLGAFLEQTGTCPDLCEITLNTAVYIRTTR